MDFTVSPATGTAEWDAVLELLDRLGPQMRSSTAQRNARKKRSTGFISRV